MVNQNSETQQIQELYRADPSMISNLKALRDYLQNLCRQDNNQKVSVVTLDGQVYEGTIVNCDRGLLYLQVENSNLGYGSYTPLILLVLYELVIITLM